MPDLAIHFQGCLNTLHLFEKIETERSCALRSAVIVCHLEKCLSLQLAGGRHLTSDVQRGREGGQ